MTLADYSMDELDQVMLECRWSQRKFSKFFFPERFRVPFDPPHAKMMALLQHGEKTVLNTGFRPIKKKAIAAPRGLGKTSILMSFMARLIVFRLARFIVYTSSSQDKAIRETENLKLELRTNTLIRSLFGDVKLRDEAIRDDKFSKKEWVANDYTIIVPRGGEQDHRGLLWKDFRPDCLINDDCQDKRTIKSLDQRNKFRDWYEGDVMYCPSMDDKSYQHILADTIKDRDSLLANKMTEAGWKSIRLSICDDDLKSLAPHMLSDAEVAREFAEAQKNGTLHNWAMERRSIVRPRYESLSFDQNMFKQYNETDEWFRKIVREFENFVIIDPCKSSESGESDAAIIGFGYHPVRNMIPVRQVVSGKLSPADTIDAAISVADQLSAGAIGIEVTGLNEWATHTFIDEMRKRRRLYNIVELHAHGKKEDRIQHMLPYYKFGYMLHNSTCCGPLELQLLGESNKNDIADAVSYIPALLEKLGRFLMPPTDSDDLNADPNEDEFLEVMNDEFANDPVFGGKRAKYGLTIS